MNIKWKQLVIAIANQKDIDFEFRVTQLIQAILESGWGTSGLFTRYNNPYGMKYRNAMVDIAVPVSYTASDAVRNEYCFFDNIENAVKGYWVFLDRPVYNGYKDVPKNAMALIRFLVSCGYAGGDLAKRAEYIEKCGVLLPTAKQIIYLLENNNE